MKLFFRKLHLWFSVPFGIIITLVCFSGAMLVFEREFSQLTNPSLYNVEEVGESPLSLDEIASIVQDVLPEGVEVQGITVYPDPEKAYQVSLSKPRRASMYIDQYTGEIKGRYERDPFFATMFSLHRWLLDNRPGGDGVFWGKVIVGTSTLMFVFVLVSGIIIWWPRTIKGLKNNLKVSFNKGWHRMWHGLHVAGGVYVLLILLVMALTGLTWSFGWYRTGFYKVFGVEAQQGGGHGQGQGKGHGQGTQKGQGKGRGRAEMEQTVNVVNFEYWQKVYDKLSEANPDCISIGITDGAATVSNNRIGNTRGSDSYTFDPATGNITGYIRYAELPRSGKIRGWIYSVHTGTFGGMTVRMLWFFVALFGATLPLTGYYLWIKRLINKRK